MKKVNNSIVKNALLNIAKTLLSIIFPLITFPYVSRILQVDNLGKVNYAASIISYYTLFAGLGIATYAVREGARVRSSRAKLEKFVSQVFTINVIATAIVYIIFAASLLCIAEFRAYSLLLIIESFSILFTTVGVDWINIIYEDYAYITVRSFFVQLLSLIAMFIFVRSASDYYIYAIITVASQGLVSFLNIIHIKKYCRLRITTNIEFRKHIRSILILFSNNVAVSIYVNSDMTMIGWLVGAYYVGLYAVSAKVYNLVKQVLAALYNVVIARMSFYYAEERISEFKNLLNSVINSIIIVSIPATVGMICTSREIIRLISGSNYEEATLSLQILSAAFFFAIMGGVFANCVNLPLKREKVNLIATTISAIENIGLNFWLIPLFKQNGAALTTLVAEFTVSVVLLYSVRDHFELFNFKEIGVNLLKSITASLLIFVLDILLKYFLGLTGIKYLLLEVLGGIILYCACNVVLKNKWMLEVLKSILKKVK